MVAVTGAFHEDGLADTADGVWGGWSPEQRLTIMRDSRLGTYGASALVGALALRWALLAPLEVGDFARAVFAGHVTGRAAALVLIGWLPAVRDQGHGAAVAGRLSRAGALLAGATTGLTLVLTLGWWWWAPLVGTALGVGALRRLARRRLGGLTGDVLGAVTQVVLLIALATVAALVRRGWL